MSTATALDCIGVGIDTARYGHRVAFLRPDRQPAAKSLTVLENQAGYRALQQRLDELHQKHPQAHFHVRIDAAGQYATNLENFLRGLGLPMTLSIGEPKRNKDYQKAHFPKRTSDDTESHAMARFAVVEQPPATPAPTPAMILLREVAGRLQAQVKQTTQATNRAIGRLGSLLDLSLQAAGNLAEQDHRGGRRRRGGRLLDDGEACHGMAFGIVAGAFGEVRFLIVLVAFGLADRQGHGQAEAAQEVFEIGGVLAGGIDADMEMGLGMFLMQLIEALLQGPIAGLVFQDGKGLGGGLAIGPEEGDAMAVACGVDADADAVEGCGCGHEGPPRNEGSRRAGRSPGCWSAFARKA